MAYAPTKHGTGWTGCADPGVVWIHLNNSSAATDGCVAVPWDSKLVYAYGLVSTAVASGAMAVKLEQFKAGGTHLGTITFSSGDSVGQAREVVLAPGQAADEARIFGRGELINIEVDGAGAASKGGANVWLYFEAQ